MKKCIFCGKVVDMGKVCAKCAQEMIDEGCLDSSAGDPAGAELEKIALRIAHDCGAIPQASDAYAPLAWEQAEAQEAELVTAVDRKHTLVMAFLAHRYYRYWHYIAMLRNPQRNPRRAA